LPEVNDLDVKLDADIANFKLEDLGDMDTIVNESVVEEVAKLGGSARQCHAVNYPANPRKRRRCGASCAKDCNLCHRHNKARLGGQSVVMFDDII
jgi:hypothetical protein